MDIWKTIQTGEGFEELEQNLMNLDSTFKFKCRRCGKCCKSQHTILFSAWDIFRIAKKIGKTPSAVIKDYTEVYIGPQSRIPVVHLLMQGKKNACPFLSEEGRCSIHDAKPTVCALYPLGRVVVSKNPGEALNGDSSDIVQYIMSGHCGSVKKAHTVRDWLSSFGIPENDEFFYLWTGLQLTLGTLVRELETAGVSETLLQPLWNAMVFKMYVDYDTNQEFFPQFRKNSDKLLHDMPELGQLLKSSLGGTKS